MSAAPVRRWTGALSVAAGVHLAAAWIILGQAPDLAGGGGAAGAGISLALAGGPPTSATAQPIDPEAAAPVQPPDAETTNAEAPAEPQLPREVEPVPVPDPQTAPILEEQPVGSRAAPDFSGNRDAGGSGRTARDRGCARAGRRRDRAARYTTRSA